MGILDEVKRWARARRRDSRPGDDQREFMEAVVAGAAAVAAANGVVQSEEMAKLVELIRFNAELSVFETDEVMSLFEHYTSGFEIDYRVGKLEAFKAIAKIPKGTADAKLLAYIACAVAEADGIFDERERAVVGEICWKLGLDRHEIMMPEPAHPPPRRPAPVSKPSSDPSAMPDWMRDPDGALERAEPVQPDPSPKAPRLPEKLPDWMKSSPPHRPKPPSTIDDNAPKIPDWMKKTPAGRPQKPESKSKSKSDNAVPDWMKPKKPR